MTDELENAVDNLADWSILATTDGSFERTRNVK